MIIFLLCARGSCGVIPGTWRKRATPIRVGIGGSATLDPPYYSGLLDSGVRRNDSSTVGWIKERSDESTGWLADETRERHSGQVTRNPEAARQDAKRREGPAPESFNLGMPDLRGCCVLTR